MGRYLYILLESLASHLLSQYYKVFFKRIVVIYRNREMNQLIGILFFLLIFPSAFSQADDSLKQQELLEVRIDKNFDQKYRRRLNQLRRTYPMALHAKKMIEEFEAELARIERRRTKKKYGKAAHRELKSEFSFNIKDLYVDEGDLLLRLIHRETGMTVSEIIKKYHGKTQHGVYATMAKLWGHSLKDRYDPSGDDWLTELIIKDINDGHIPFDKSMNKLDKEGYKKSMKSYRATKRANRKNSRRVKKQLRQEK